MWSVPERLECEVLQKVRYINTLTFTYLYLKWKRVAFYGPPCSLGLFQAHKDRRYHSMGISYQHLIGPAHDGTGGLGLAISGTVVWNRNKRSLFAKPNYLSCKSCSVRTLHKPRAGAVFWHPGTSRVADVIYELLHRKTILSTHGPLRCRDRADRVPYWRSLDAEETIFVIAST